MYVKEKDCMFFFCSSAVVSVLYVCVFCKSGAFFMVVCLVVTSLCVVCVSWLRVLTWVFVFCVCVCVCVCVCGLVL